MKTSTITNGFREVGLLCDEEDSTNMNLPEDESDTENVKESEKVCDEAILRLFNSDTEENNFSGFSVQEEDEDSDH